MIELSESMKSVLNQLRNVLRGSEWEVRLKTVDHVDQYGNLRKDSALRVVRKHEGMFFTTYGDKEYFPLMPCLSYHWLSDDEWDGDRAFFEERAAAKGLSMQEVEALAAALNGHSAAHPNALARVLNGHINGI